MKHRERERGREANEECFAGKQGKDTAATTTTTHTKMSIPNDDTKSARNHTLDHTTHTHVSPF